VAVPRPDPDPPTPTDLPLDPSDRPRPSEAPADPGPATEASGSEPAEGRGSRRTRLFGSEAFFRLWLVQLISSLGDWLAFSAIILLATDIGGGSAAGAVSLVMAARIVPGFLFGPVAGVLVDRWDRKKVMVTCNLGRALVLGMLPFVENVSGLVIASLLLEVMTLLWAPAKEAEVPNLVPHDHLTTANSLSLAAAYGTFPFASLLFALLAGVSVWVGAVPGLGFLENDQMALAFYVDSAILIVAAWMIQRLPLSTRQPPRQHEGVAESERAMGVALRAAIAELKEGWREIAANHTVRAVNIGLATGLIGGGMLVPLGPVFSIEVLGAGTAGFGFFIFALGCGVAIGVVLLSVFQRRVPKAEVFAGSLLVAGVSLVVAASMSTLGLAALFVAVLGVCAGAVYVLGFTLLHESVDDELRGRIFSALYTLVRFCVLIAFAVGPLLSDLLNRLSNRLVDGELSVGGVVIGVPGVRLTLWLAGLIIIGAGILAVRAVRPISGVGSIRDLREEIVSGLTAPITEVKRSHEHPSAWSGTTRVADTPPVPDDEPEEPVP
jgi:dTMP kinase